MDIPADLLPAGFLWGAAILYGLMLTIALLTAPWSKLADNEASHVYFATVVVVCLLWTLHAGIAPGHNYHLLGVTSLCLMFDWQFALLAVSLALLVTTWQGPAGWEAFAVNALVMGALPLLSMFGRNWHFLAPSWAPERHGGNGTCLGEMAKRAQIRGFRGDLKKAGERIRTVDLLVGNVQGRFLTPRLLAG